MKNKVKILREQTNITQGELAEKSGLSLRTIQRIEAGNIPKGFTLKAIAQALDVTPQDLVSDEHNLEIERAKLINFFALSGLIIPFGSVIFPLILTCRTKEVTSREIGKDIVSLQIILAAILSVLMILSPFVQNALSMTFPLFLVPLIGMLVLKVVVVFKNAVSLNRSHNLCICLKNSFL